MPIAKDSKEFEVDLELMGGAYIQNVIRDDKGRKICARCFRMRIFSKDACVSEVLTRYRPSYSERLND